MGSADGYPELENRSGTVRVGRGRRGPAGWGSFRSLLRARAAARCRTHTRRQGSAARCDEPFPWENTSDRWVVGSCAPERLAVARLTERVESDPPVRKRSPIASGGFSNNRSAQIVLSVSRRTRSRDSDQGTRTPERSQHRSPYGSPCGSSGASTAAIAFNGAAARPALGPGSGGPLRARRCAASARESRRNSPIVSPCPRRTRGRGFGARPAPAGSADVRHRR